jgi:holo-[acyl-carrier protein] synthase
MKQSQIGIDIIEISRIKEVVSRWGGRFLRRVYTAAELELCRNRAESLAARFAGKEAAIKALSIQGSVIGWREVEILSETSGRPIIHLHSQAKEQAKKLGFVRLEISLSHSKEYAVAVVLGIADG